MIRTQQNSSVGSPFIASHFGRKHWTDFKVLVFHPLNCWHSLGERMLLEYRHGWHTLNAIAREISVQRLKQASNEWIQAHSLAANYHARHFRAKQILHVKGLAVLLLNCAIISFRRGGLRNLKGLSERFTAFIRQSINFTQIPSEQANLDERIALLTILLGKQGAKGLEYHLARCLLKRKCVWRSRSGAGNTSDAQQAHKLPLQHG